MTTRLTPYLQFDGDAAEAMRFFASVFGGDLQLMTFADMGGMGMPEEHQGRVMHAALIVDDAISLMGADSGGMDGSVMGDRTQTFIALSGEDADRLRGWFDALAADGTVEVPLERAPWGDSFGQVQDRWGHHWMVNIAGA